MSVESEAISSDRVQRADGYAFPKWGLNLLQRYFALIRKESRGD